MTDFDTTSVAEYAGQPGPPGVSWVGPYNPAQTYTERLVVLFKGGLWVCLRPTTGVDPDSDSTRWGLFLPPAVNGVNGANGVDGIDGTNGTDGVDGQAGVDGVGWAPVTALVVGPGRTVCQIVDWLGGTGVKPATGQYIGTNGFVLNPADAVSVQGPVGISGANFIAQSHTFLSPKVGTIAVTLTPRTAVGYAPCQYLALISQSNTDLSMSGHLVSYDSAKSILTLAVEVATGLSSAADWIITPMPPPSFGYGVDAGYDDDPTANAAFLGDPDSLVVASFSDLAAFIQSPPFLASLPTSPPPGGGLYLDNNIVTVAFAS